MATPTLEQLFTYSHEHEASDLHLVVNEPPIVRVDGNLLRIKDQSVLTAENIEAMIRKTFGTTVWDEFFKTRNMDLSYQIKNGIRFRVNIHWAQNQPGLVARVIPSTIPSLEEIMMPEIVTELTRLDFGLILVTGQTGSGKSTTLASMIDDINTNRNQSIVTLEDPIEFVFEPKNSIVMQRQLGQDMNTFPDGLKYVLRQDPDVIMIGEMRDLDTIATTITLAETGHLVLATLHTLNASQTIDRIIDVFPPHQQAQVRLQLSISLRAIFSQRLVQRTDGKLMAAREVLINTPAVSNLIRENKIAQIKSVIQTNSKEGMNTMDQDLKRLVKEGYITKEVALQHVLEPDSL